MVAFGGLLFALGYLGITLEHKLNTNKSAIALLMGSLLWVVVALAGVPHYREALSHTGAEIFEIIIFLIGAMSLVEVLAHYKFFDIVRGRLYTLGATNTQQFYILTILAFLLSAVVDNLTTTIVMIQIARRFFTGDNLIRAAAGIVIAINAGGAFSPIGDVTTIMLWLAGKFTSTEIITQAIVPALVLVAVSLGMLGRGITNEHNDDTKGEILTKLCRSEKVVVALAFLAFPLPILMNSMFQLPPYIGRLIGLGLVWVAVDVFRQIRPQPTHLGASIDHMLQKIDIASLKFFIGILLAVAALHQLGILEMLSTWLFTDTPTDSRIITGSIGLGLLSAILDNVPLAAMSLNLLTTQNPELWVLLALTLGTGGSILVIGSAAGVVAMGAVKEMTFAKYLKIATLPALCGFTAAVITWWLQRLLV